MIRDSILDLTTWIEDKEKVFKKIDELEKIIENLEERIRYLEENSK